MSAIADGSGAPHNLGPVGVHRQHRPLYGTLAYMAVGRPQHCAWLRRHRGRTELALPKPATAPCSDRMATHLGMELHGSSDIQNGTTGDVASDLVDCRRTLCNVAHVPHNQASPRRRQARTSSTTPSPPAASTEGIRVRAMNSVEEWGASDHCRLLIEVTG